MLEVDVDTHPSQCSEIALRETILHITADYPDCNKPVNTYAIKNFIDQIDCFDNYIVCISRTALPWRCKIVPGGGVDNPRLISVKYWGFPFGVFLALSMYIVARRIRSIIRSTGHAHRSHPCAQIGLRRAGRILAVPLDRHSDGLLAAGARSSRKSCAPNRIIGRSTAAVARRSKFLYFVSAWVRAGNQDDAECRDRQGAPPAEFRPASGDRAATRVREGPARVHHGPR